MRFIVAICSSVHAPVPEPVGLVSLSVIEGVALAGEFCALTAAPAKQKIVITNSVQRGNCVQHDENAIRSRACPLIFHDRFSAFLLRVPQ
jgi:hypothetical protein